MPYRDTPFCPCPLDPGRLIYPPDSSVDEAEATGLLLQALLFVAQQEPFMPLPYVLRPVVGWQIVQCGMQ